MNHLPLYARTLSSLKASQVAYLILRRFLPTRKFSALKVEPRLRQGIRMYSSCSSVGRFLGEHTFCFLNRTKVFPNGQVNWSCREMPKLWRYNLHYFDYLLDPASSIEYKCHLIADWIMHNPPCTEDAWEPYTVSLRIVNWIQFFSNNQDTIREEWLESLYQQARWLETNIEYHILANHYLKNGVALFFVGAFLEGPDADRWLQKGRKILREELEEQFLGDGGHYERSPMYHSICVTDYLNVLNLMTASSRVITFDEADFFRTRITQAVDFLADICMPDGEIPLFNDSAFGIAEPPEVIFEYARKVISYRTAEIPAKQVAREKPESGYYVMRHLDDMMIIDCGAIGPDYQPGHAHCDTLSYELAIDGRRLIVDSGVHDYEATEQRAYARSTRAHNTVVINGQEQSEIWGVFRVARRAKPLPAYVRQESDGRLCFEGAHDGYQRLSNRLVHRRQITYDGGAEWEITDHVEGAGTHFIDSYVHLHPDFKSIQHGIHIHVIDASGRSIVKIEVMNNAQIRFETGRYFPEFGIELKTDVIVFSCSGHAPLTLAYRIIKVSPRPVFSSKS